MSFLIYKSGGTTHERRLPPQYSFRLWRPSLRNPIPSTLGFGFGLWTLAHYVRLFRNRDYAVFFVVNADGILVHRSCIIPAYFRWPFMDRNDLQISSTWTNPDERGKGLATSALVKAMKIMDRPGRKYWYVTREENIASKAVCEKAGFSLVGHGKRVSWLGIRMLGRLTLED